MSVITKIKHAISFLLHGETKPVYADIHYLEPNRQLKGKRIVITGGSRGLGFAMAKKFMEEGAVVLIAGRNEETLKQAASQLSGCQYLVLDVQKPSTFDTFFSQAEEFIGEVDCLVNNAGISLHEPTFFDVTPETFNKQVDTNLKGSFFLTQAFLRKTVSRKKPANVLFISSETGDTMDFRPYGFTKAAVNSMVQGLAFLFRKDNIRINAVAPGITATEMTGIQAEGNLDAGDYAAGRYYLPEEIAQTAVFLLSEASGCISGQIITCNNAQTINARWK